MLRIMPMGDSNTWGVGNPDLQADPATSVGYRLALKQLLAADGIAATFCGAARSGYAVLDDYGHEGWPGQGIAQLRRRVAEGALETYRPDVLLLLVGSNDLWVSLQDRRPISAQAARGVVRRLGRLLDEIARRCPTLPVIVAQPDTPANAPIPLALYRAGIAQLVAERQARGRPIVCIDARGAEHDGVHYTVAGHEELARRWHAALVALARESVPVVRCAAQEPDRVSAKVYGLLKGKRLLRGIGKALYYRVAGKLKTER